MMDCFALIISRLITKSKKPHTMEAKLILPAIEETLKPVIYHPNPGSVIKAISLINDSVQKKIDEMSEDVEKILCMKLQTKNFNLQLDESTLPGNELLILSYVRFVDEGKVVAELLFAKELTTDTKGETIFIMVDLLFKQKNSFAKFDCMCNRWGSCFNWTSQGISCLFEKGSS